MSAKKPSPSFLKRSRIRKTSTCEDAETAPDNEPALGRLSKSASELSTSTREPQTHPGPRARSAAHHRSHQTPLSIVTHKTHNFFSTLRSRWQRSRSRERQVGAALSLASGAGGDSSGTDYTADHSSGHSTPGQSPRHKLKLQRNESSHGKQNGGDPIPSTSGAAHSSRTSVPHEIYPVAVDEVRRQKESQLRQYSFFQLRVHLKRGQNLVAMDKNGLLAGTSDPYVKFKSSGRLLHKSKIVYRDLNPVWDETFTVPVEDPFQPVNIKVFDYDWGLQDDFMGSCSVDLIALELGRPQDLVLCLQDPNKSSTQDLGEIVMSVTLWPKTQEDKEQVRF